MKFPNFHRVIDIQHPNEGMHYAIIEDGKILLTTGHILVHSDLCVFAKNIEHAEGKVLGVDLLMWLAQRKFKEIICTPEGFEVKQARGKSEKRPYTGCIKPDSLGRRKIYLLGEDEPLSDYFPNWKSVIPKDSYYPATPKYTIIGMNPTSMRILADCFSIDRNDGLKIHIPDELKYGYKVTLIEPPYGKGEQIVLMMPHHFNN